MSANPTSADVRELLARAAAAQAPTVDPDFADRLEQRLRAVHESMALASVGTATSPRASGARRTLRRLARLPLTALVAMVVAATAATAAVVVPVARHLVHRNDTPATTVIPSTTLTGPAGLVAAVPTTVRLDVPPSTEFPITTVPPDGVAASAGAVDFGADEVPAVLAPDVTPPAAPSSTVSRPVPVTTTATTTTRPLMGAPPVTAGPVPTVAVTTSTTLFTTSTTTASTTTSTTTTSTSLPTTSTSLPTTTTVAPTTTREPAPTTTRPPEPPTTVATGEGRTSVPTFPMACTAGLRAITCSWSAAAPPGSTYRLLRSEPGGTVGRVLTPAVGAASYEDATVTVGGTYVYLLQAVSGSGTVLTQSTPATVTCCRV